MDIRQCRAGGLARPSPTTILPTFPVPGGVAEWLKAHAWKACIRETVSWVRIPLPPLPGERNWKLKFFAVLGAVNQREATQGPRVCAPSSHNHGAWAGG